MVPTFKFHGSKCRIAKWLFSRIGDTHICNYYEPFAGRGNAFFFFASNFNYEKAFLNDLNMEHFLTALKEYSGDYTFVPDFITRPIFESLRDSKNDFERSLAESFCAYNGNTWSNGANLTNSPSHPSKNRHSKSHTISRMLVAKELLANADISSNDFVDFCNRTFCKDDLIYCDPPYLGTKAGAGGNINHNKLCEILLSVPAKVILSGYENTIYDSFLHNWNKRFFARASCAKNNAGASGKAVEIVWENF